MIQKASFYNLMLAEESDSFTSYTEHYDDTFEAISIMLMEQNNFLVTPQYTKLTKDGPGETAGTN